MTVRCGTARVVTGRPFIKPVLRSGRKSCTSQNTTHGESRTRDHSEHRRTIGVNRGALVARTPLGKRQIVEEMQPKRSELLQDATETKTKARLEAWLENR